MSKVHLVIPDCHAHYLVSNRRANWLSSLISELKPDVVVNLGDTWDMPSMSNYDKGKASFIGRTYKQDLVAGLDFNERLWYQLRKQKRKMPYRVFLEGNHEYRLKKAIDIQPELNGIISFKDFDLSRHYDDIVEYDGNFPGIINVDGINYAHYFTSGNMGYAISGLHQAFNMISKLGATATAGHSHILDFKMKQNLNGTVNLGLSAGVYMAESSDWAGQSERDWWRGVVIKRQVEDGYYEPEFVSINTLRRLYGDK